MPNRTTLRTLLFIVVLLGGCGRKGPPKPPEDFAPLPVKNLNVQASVDGVNLTWEAPLPDPDMKEEDLVPLAGFIFQRSEFSREGSSDFEVLQELKVKLSDQPIAQAAVQAAGQPPVQAIYKVTDTKVLPGRIYDYQVLTFNSEGGKGEPGQSVRVTFLGENSRIERIAVESTRKGGLNKAEDVVDDY